MIRVLFVCIRNSARSQMAEGLARHFGAGKVEAFSAGSQPTSVHPFAVSVMQERDIDISSQFSKSFSDVANHYFDYVITLCGKGEVSCPVFPGQYERLYWPLPDPSTAKGSVEDKLSAFRNIREALSKRIQELFESQILTNRRDKNYT